MLLTQKQLEFFHSEGFLVAKGVIPPNYINSLQDEIGQVIDAKAREHKESGEISELYEDLGFLYRATKLHEQCPKILGPVNSGNHAGEAMFALITCPLLLDVIGQLVGPEIVASSVYRIRPKLPDSPEGIVPWHQDSGYFHTMGDDHLIVTAWIPLMNATVEAGCMEVMPRSHLHGVRRHFWAIDPAPPLTVHPEDVPDWDPVPVPADIGDVVLMTNKTMHRSTANMSGKIRWAADLRYNAPEAGDYYTSEAGFLARSSQRVEEILTEAQAFESLRKNHVGAGSVDRTWPDERKGEISFA
jgi:hypothetical protein